MQPEISYKVGDHISLEEYKKLSEEDQKKCFSAEIKINFPSEKIFIDMTNKTYLNKINSSEKAKLINGFNYVYEYSFFLGANTNTEVLFYKQDIMQDYTYPFKNELPIIEVNVKTAS